MTLTFHTRLVVLYTHKTFCAQVRKQEVFHIDKAPPLTVTAELTFSHAFLPEIDWIPWAAQIKLLFFSYAVGLSLKSIY